MESVDLIIPVPLYKSKRRSREFNQAEILAKKIAEEFNIEISVNILKRIKPTRSMSSLSFQQRFKNLNGAFLAQPQRSLEDLNILVIDDLLTTGTTLSESAKALKLCGARRVWGLTLASVPEL
jgi:ComF family protein